MMDNNKENLFMHRLQGTFSGNRNMLGGSGILTRHDHRPSSPMTYWKSPYAKDRHSIFNNKGSVTGFMRPQMTVAASKMQHKLPMRESKSAIKGILKQSDIQEIAPPEASMTNEETTHRVSYGKPNLITTGTGSGRPHGVPERSQSSDRHVKFGRLPKPLSASDASVWTAGNGSFRPGRKLTVKRNVAPIRQLGSGLINYRTPVAYSSIVTLSGGETQIKSQIEAFVKKLRMAESAKLAKMAAENDKDSQKETANKLRKTRSESASRYFHDWKEFDLDNNPANYITPDFGTGDNQENAYDAKGDNQMISGNELSDRDSLSSTTLDIADESTTRPARPKPMASLYTKYRHITTNDVNLHKYDDIYQNIVLRRSNHRPESVKGQDESPYFCDAQKASDIIGWLADVEIAKTDIQKSEAV